MNAPHVYWAYSILGILLNTLFNVLRLRKGEPHFKTWSVTATACSEYGSSHTTHDFTERDGIIMGPTKYFQMCFNEYVQSYVTGTGRHWAVIGRDVRSGRKKINFSSSASWNITQREYRRWRGGELGISPFRDVLKENQNWREEGNY
jgi:hypothetical protein